MATAEEYASWIVSNKDKQGTPEFEKVSKAYSISRQQTPDPVAPVEDEKPTVPKVAKESPTLTASMPLLDVGKKAIANIPKSGSAFLGNIYDAVTSPIETAKNVARVASGTMQNLGYPSRVTGPDAEWDAENKKIASAVGGMYKDRYGGLENIKKTIAEDPVGFLSDASTVLTGGGAAAAKLPGLAGKFAKTVNAAGKIIDPINITANAVKPVLNVAGKAAANIIGGLGTHTGAESIKTAAKAGYAGGQSADDFTSALRGASNSEDVVTDMRSALSNIRKKRGDTYSASMAGVKADTAVLDFKPIDKALIDISDVGTFKGKVINRSTAETLKKINDLVEEWRVSSPADFHTAEGLDALKRAIGDVRESTEFGSPSRLVAGKVYNAVKKQIVDQAPEYAKTMKGYEDASALIKEIERSLSAGEKASSDTALRKLQSVMRNNVNTNYGKRLELVEKLKEAGAGTIMEKLAGQALNKWTPRGLGSATAVGTGGVGYMVGGPALAAAIMAGQSPRLMGEAAYYGGRAAGAGRDAMKLIPKGSTAAAFQSGRLKDIIEQMYANQ